MKSLISLIILLFFSISVISQSRIVKKSGTKPQWVNNIRPNYIITCGSGNTIELAKKDAMAMVKEQIVRSIADKVIAKSEMVKSESSINNTESDIIEHFKSSIKSESGKIDFLTGININKVEDYYWEEIKNRKTKVISYNYHLKYPFPEFQLHELIVKYKKKDKELTDELEKYLSLVANIESTEDISTAISALRMLRGNFIDKRQDKADLAIEKLKSFYKNTDIKILQKSSNKICFTLHLDGKELGTGKKPIIKTNCARILELNKKGNIWELEFDSQDCYPEEENFVNISINLPGNRIKKKIYFDITESLAKISVVGNILVKRDTISKENRCILSIRSEYGSPLYIESIRLDFNEDQIFTKNNLHKRFEGKGLHNLDVDLPNDVNISNKSGEVTGYIIYKSENSEKNLSFKLYRYNYIISL